MSIAWRILAAVVLVLGAFALGTRAGWRGRDAVAAREASAAQEAALGTVRAALEADGRAALALSGVRADIAKGLGAIDATIDGKTFSKEVRYVGADGKSVVCVQRDPVAYGGVFDAAVTGSAGPAAAPGGVP